jgi:hypothetical protein
VELTLPVQHVTVSTTSVPIESGDITIYSSLIAQGHMAQVTSSIHDNILCANPAPSLDRIKRYDARILDAFHALPDFVRHPDPKSAWHRACSITLWRIRDFRAILYRPVLLTAAWDARRQKQLSAGVREAIEWVFK